MLRIGTFSNVTLERLCKRNNMVVGTTARKNYLRHGCGVDKDIVRYSTSERKSTRLVFLMICRYHWTSVTVLSAENSFCHTPRPESRSREFLAGINAQINQCCEHLLHSWKSMQ